MFKLLAEKLNGEGIISDELIAEAYDFNELIAAGREQFKRFKIICPEGNLFLAV